ERSVLQEQGVYRKRKREKKERKRSNTEKHNLWNSMSAAGVESSGAGGKGRKIAKWSRERRRRKYFSIPEAQEYGIIPKGRGRIPPSPSPIRAIFLPMRPRVRGRERSLVGSDKGLPYCEGERALKDITKGKDGLDADTLQFTLIVSLSSGGSAFRHSPLDG
ncbi:hypothetical protein AVEN_164008-2-1, partial [Araneus ventricosus]